MKGTVNKAIILGRLGQDPETKTTSGGMQITNLSVATSHRGPKDESGQPTEATEWHRVTLFGKTAEIAAQYLNKGSQVYIEGRIQTRKWQDQQGNDKYTTEIVGNEMQFIGGKSDSQQAAISVPRPTGQPAHTYQPPQPKGGFQQQPAQGFSKPTGAPAPAPAGGLDDFDDEAISFG